MSSIQYVTLRDFFRRCYKPLRLRGRSKDGIRLHEITLNNFAKFLGREAQISDLEADTIVCFLAWLRERGRAAITANDNRNRLMALARFAVKKGQLKEEPEVQPEIEPERVPRAWLTTDLDALFSACIEQHGRIGSSPANVWWLSLHLVCLFSGERIRAVLSLRWDQLDLDGGYMMLTAEQRKGRLRDREWELPAEAIAALRHLKRTSTGELVFEKDFCLGTLYNRYAKLLKRAGLPTDRKSKFHRIRKSTASHSKAAGGDAQELMDHSSAKVTKFYLDKRIVKPQSTVDLLKVPRAAMDFVKHSPAK